MFEVSTDRARLDVARIHRWLSEESYWANGIPRAILERAIENSLCFGIYDGGEQIAFARVISDYATYAYLCDVFVAASHRGRGVGKELMRAVREHPSLQGLRRWGLATRDAHGLYEQFGFTPLSMPERMMEVLVKNPYGALHQ
jgi:GNAT superfamily N-acetyltransferase